MDHENNRYKITCCKDCPNRHGGCHSTCEKYKQQRKEYDQTIAEVKKRDAIRTGLNGFLFNNIEQTNKRLNRKGR